MGYMKKVHSALGTDYNKDNIPDHDELGGDTLERFRGFIRSLVMHGAVGTALGGVCTLVGEPQNLLIAEEMGWTFIEFFLNMAHITMPVLAAGLITCAVLEITKKLVLGSRWNPPFGES